MARRSAEQQRHVTSYLALIPNTWYQWDISGYPPYQPWYPHVPSLYLQVLAVGYLWLPTEDDTSHDVPAHNANEDRGGIRSDRKFWYRSSIFWSVRSMKSENRISTQKYQDRQFGLGLSLDRNSETFSYIQRNHRNFQHKNHKKKIVSTYE